MVVLPHWASSGYSLQAATQGDREDQEETLRTKAHISTFGIMMQYPSRAPPNKTVGVIVCYAPAMGFIVCYLPWPAAGSAARP